MLVSDVLVTDYSSVIYEFALLGRPIAFLAPDDGAYDEERGFYFDFRAEAPGPIVDNTEELAAVIRENRFDLERVTAFAQGVVRRHRRAGRRGGWSTRSSCRRSRGVEVTAASLEARTGPPGPDGPPAGTS